MGAWELRNLPVRKPFTSLLEDFQKTFQKVFQADSLWEDSSESQEGWGFIRKSMKMKKIERNQVE